MAQLDSDSVLARGSLESELLSTRFRARQVTRGSATFALGTGAQAIKPIVGQALAKRFGLGKYVVTKESANVTDLGVREVRNVEVPAGNKIHRQSMAAVAANDYAYGDFIIGGLVYRSNDS
jgi:hypothetical protein